MKRSINQIQPGEPSPVIRTGKPSPMIILKSYEKVNLFILIFSIVLFLSFLFYFLPGESERSKEYFGDTKTPDTSFIYSGNDLFNMAKEFGQSGRDYYIRSRITFDIIWPVSYGLFLWALIATLGKSIKNKSLKTIILLPFLGVILDYLENAGASAVMYFYPVRINLLNNVVPVFTFLKWVLIGATFFVVIFLIVYRIACFIKTCFE